jgi:hypothetical protein
MKMILAAAVLAALALPASAHDGPQWHFMDHGADIRLSIRSWCVPNTPQRATCAHHGDAWRGGGLPSDGRGRWTTRSHSPRRQRLGARPGVLRGGACEEEPVPASSSHGVHCHLTVMRDQLGFSWPGLSRQRRYSAAQAATRFTK